jgi:proton-dependent oligopeptide transporter, POT family
VAVSRPLVIPDQVCSKEWETQYPASDDEPSAGDIANLRRVRDSLPYSVWAASIMGMAERFAFYGASAPFQNYIQNSIDDPFHPGALGLGQATATTINYAFLLFGFVTPIPMAIITDRWLGRYKVICMCIA